MRHQYNKFKLSGGKDANDMLLRKLAVNFFTHGKMTTTEKKGKSISSYVAKLVEKTKERNEANKNYLLRHLSSVKMVNSLFEKVGPVLKDINGGYITLKRLQQRYSDGAMMVEIAWVKPIVLEDIKPAVTEPKKSVPTTQAAESEVKTADSDKKAPEKKPRSVKKTK